jgi:hypothetical protein
LVVENDVDDLDFEGFEEGVEILGFEKAGMEHDSVAVDSVTGVLAVGKELAGEVVVVGVAEVDTVVVVAVGRAVGEMEMVEVVDKDTAAEIGTGQVKQPQPHPNSALVVQLEEHIDPGEAHQGRHSGAQY